MRLSLPAPRGFGPDFVGAYGVGLIRAKALFLVLRDDEVLRWHGRPRQTTQERELAGVRHCVGKRSLQQTLFSHAFQQRITISEVLGQQPEHLVKALDLLVKRSERLRPIMTTDKKRTRVTKHPRHVTHQLRGRSHTLADTKRAEIRGRLA